MSRAAVPVRDRNEGKGKGTRCRTNGTSRESSGRSLRSRSSCWSIHGSSSNRTRRKPGHHDRLLGLVPGAPRRAFPDAHGAGRRDHRDRRPGFRRFLSAIHGPASSGYRSASSSASPGWRLATTSSAAKAGWTGSRPEGLLGARGDGSGYRKPRDHVRLVPLFIQTLLDNNAQTWFAPFIAFGEMAVGLGLIVGLLTGFAAFLGRS